MRTPFFVDIRDPRELQREGKNPKAWHCPRGMLEFWIDPGKPLSQGDLRAGQALRLLLRRRLALGARRQDGAGYGPRAGGPYRRRVQGLEGGRRAGGDAGAEAQALRRPPAEKRVSHPKEPYRSVSALTSPPQSRKRRCKVLLPRLCAGAFRVVRNRGRGNKVNGQCRRRGRPVGR